MPGSRRRHVGSIGWLACRPVAQKTLRWEVGPELLVVASRANSMNVIEEFGNLNEKIDALEALKDNLLPGRNRAPSRLARSLGRLADLLAAAGQSLRNNVSRVDSGLSLGPDFGRSLQRLRTELSARLDEIAAIKTDLRLHLDDEAPRKPPPRGSSAGSRTPGTPTVAPGRACGRESGTFPPKSARCPRRTREKRRRSRPPRPASAGPARR